MDGSWPQEEELVEGQRCSGRRRSGVDGLWTEVTRSISGEDDGTAEASVLAALQWIHESEVNTVSEHRLNEVEKILKNIISMSHKYSQSEAALTFFQSGSLDLVQPFFQSPVTVADIWRSNGFCLANTETILYDAHLTNMREKPRKRYQLLTRTKPEGLDCNAETDTRHQAAVTKPQNYLSSLSFLQPEACETDILE
ncbi:PX domain-containing protein 1 [Astyanax mexicanus]|uniref:PX domain-containing protein 1 n=1 Tax=Astyanax mexicanus TaxID=7994 RepID=A0A8T2LSV4_ASTMX|nr:PX domain-containing protein 1 [Astyanax mexicanus]